MAVVLGLAQQSTAQPTKPQTLSYYSSMFELPLPILSDEIKKTATFVAKLFRKFRQQTTDAAEAAKVTESSSQVPNLLKASAKFPGLQSRLQAQAVRARASRANPSQRYPRQGKAQHQNASFRERREPVPSSPCNRGLAMSSIKTCPTKPQFQAPPEPQPRELLYHHWTYREHFAEPNPTCAN